LRDSSKDAIARGVGGGGGGGAAVRRWASARRASINRSGGNGLLRAAPSSARCVQTSTRRSMRSTATTSTRTSSSRTAAWASAWCPTPASSAATSVAWSAATSGWSTTRRRAPPSRWPAAPFSRPHLPPVYARLRPRLHPRPPRPPSGLQALGAYAAAALRPKLHRAAARGADAVQRAVLLAAEDQKLALCTSLMKEVRSAPPRPAGRPSCLDDPLPHTLHLTPASRPPPSPGRWRRCSATTLAWKSRRRRSRPRGARRARRRGGRCGAPWLCASPRRARRLLAGSRGARRAARGGW
jgi:hypothetical protein